MSGAGLLRGGRADIRGRILTGIVALPIRTAGKGNVADQDSIERRADVYAFCVYDFMVAKDPVF